jgi:hypothetical protein
MSLDKLLKSKPPKQPKGPEDKDLDRKYKEFVKALETFQAAGKTFAYAVGAYGPAMVELYDQALFKSGERNLDPDKKKAYEALLKEMRDHQKIWLSLQ